MVGRGGVGDAKMKFERTPEYDGKLFLLALCDEKNIIRDAKIELVYLGNKLKAYCEASNTYLQFPTNLRTRCGRMFIADVVEVIRTDGVTKYYRAMGGSIRDFGDDEVLA